VIVSCIYGFAVSEHSTFQYHFTNFRQRTDSPTQLTRFLVAALEAPQHSDYFVGRHYSAREFGRLGLSLPVKYGTKGWCS